MNVLHVGLSKWPAMAVIGESVTREQAMEIIVRTERWPLSCNDRAFTAQVNKLAGIHSHEDYWDLPKDKPNLMREMFDEDTKACEALGVLNIEYLHNSRIASAYVGGPHGWCNWDGKIACNSYNIGKWPSVEAVLTEWALIAKTFPYLKLRCQLFSGEQCEAGVTPLIEFRVAGGKAEVCEPSEPLTVVDDAEENITALISMPTAIRERGITLAGVTEALEVTRKRAI